MSITTQQANELASGSGKVYAGSDKIGSIGQVYLDDASGEPTWVTAKTGLFGTAETFVPLQGARVDGDDIVVDYNEETVKGAPRVDVDGTLTPEEETELYRYYGLSDSDAVGTEGYDRTDRSETSVGHDTSGPTTDDAMTRSEERLNVGTATRESGRARLRKYVTTETVTQTVPVSRQEATLKREPITESNRGAAESGPGISEEEHEVVLHEEVPVVEKDVVGVERVKLGTETVTDEATVSDDVRQENIELVESDGTNTAKRGRTER
jgi:uncharacterized protein (TIGR02271 family)